ncbi:MAG: Unknown protein [uncultured Sulfurovum sp.]|uniref:Phosphate ABC transporter substrate-binding protein n=1 Tax=uncultured Sulfurovum sp. TaxID=269237 RepID=A0A6S6TD84_9BACT|nr:MAG: Unknown protein [uncultured Sulfurovum sp.]
MKTLLLTILLSSFAFSNISIYISHKNKLSKVSNKQIADLYLKKTDNINGIKVTPIDSQDKKLFQEFYKKVVKKNPRQLHAYWIKQIYRGSTQPPRKLSPSAIKKAMKKNKAIIAYDKDPKTGHILLTVK